MGHLKEKYTRQYFLPEPGQGYGAEGYEEFKAGDIKQSVKRILDTVTWREKSVLDIGCGRGEALRYCLEQGASRVVGIDFSEAAMQVAKETLGPFGCASTGHVQVACMEAIEIEDENEWDAILMLDVLEHIPERELGPVLWRVRRALKDSGLLIWSTPNYTDKGVRTRTDIVPETAGMHCNKQDWINLTARLCGLGFRPTAPYPDRAFFVWEKVAFQEPVPVYDPPAEVRQSIAVPKGSTILHVHNVAWLGGTGGFVLDLARAFPEFHHVALHLNGSEHVVWEEGARALGIRTLHAPVMTPEILDEINPAVVTLHNVPGKSLAGEWPYAWLNQGRCVIAWHHNPTYPLLRADLDVFVSRLVEGQYQKFLQLCRQRLVLPPCIDAETYAKFPLSSRPRYTSAGKTTPAVQEVMSGRDYSRAPAPPTLAMAEYLSGFGVAVIGSDRAESWCRTVSEAQAAGLLVLAQGTGAIPEHVEHGKTGFLWRTKGELEDLVRSVEKGWGIQDCYIQIRQAGRAWARQFVGLDRLRLALYPHLVRALTGAP